MTVKQYKTIEKKYEQYILENLDFSDYDISEDKIKTDRLKLVALRNIFINEYGFHLNRMGKAKVLKNWLKGLPSCINIDFYNHDIIKRAKVYGSLPENATKKEENKFLDKYWIYIAMRISSMWNKNKITGIEKNDKKTI